MNPQGMEEHKARGLKRLALTRLRALSREAARLADRVVATDEATRDEVPRLLGVPAAQGGRAAQRHRSRGDRARSRRRSRRAWCARRCPAPAAAAPLFLSVGRLEAYKGFDDVLARPRPAARRQELPAALGLGGGGRRARPRAALAARDARAPREATCACAGRVDEGAAARPLRARGRLRARDALRGIEPGHPGGDGPRPARGGDPRRRDPGQGGGRRDRPARGARRRGRPGPRPRRLLARSRRGARPWARAAASASLERFALGRARRPHGRRSTKSCCGSAA